MMNLQVNHPNIRAEVRAGTIVVYKTSSKCSAMASDQCHEQDNCAAKVVGLTENPPNTEALDRGRLSSGKMGCKM